MMKEDTRKAAVNLLAQVAMDVRSKEQRRGEQRVAMDVNAREFKLLRDNVIRPKFYEFEELLKKQGYDAKVIWTDGIEEEEPPASILLLLKRPDFTPAQLGVYGYRSGDVCLWLLISGEREAHGALEPPFYTVNDIDSERLEQWFELFLERMKPHLHVFFTDPLKARG